MHRYAFAITLDHEVGSLDRFEAFRQPGGNVTRLRIGRRDKRMTADLDHMIAELQAGRSRR